VKRQRASFSGAGARHGFAKVAFAGKLDRKRDVKETNRVRRLMLNGHQNAFA
jgi:hypothetical protein